MRQTCLGETILPALQADLADFMGPRWEGMVRAHLRRLAASGRLGDEIVAIGPWWTEHSDVEVDALALALAARERVERAPDDVTTITASDVFAAE